MRVLRFVLEKFVTITELTNSEFDSAWQSEPDHRYSYELNNGMLVLFGLLLGSFWTYWSLTTLSNGLDWILGSLAGVFGIITLYIIYSILVWRHYGRTSGVVCEQERLVWRDGSNILSVHWKELDIDSIGLLDTAIGDRKYEHFLNIDGNHVYLFRPFVRMRKYEGFIADVLLRLKDHGRISKKSSKKGKRKNS